MCASIFWKTLLNKDPDPDPEGWPKLARQFSIMDASGKITGIMVDSLKEGGII